MQDPLFVGGLIWQLRPFRYFVLDLVRGMLYGTMTPTNWIASFADTELD